MAQAKKTSRLKQLAALSFMLLALSHCSYMAKDIIGMQLKLVDQDGYPLEVPAQGVFRDAGGQVVATVAAKPFVLGIYSIQWYSVDQPELTAKNALRSRTVDITAEGCEPQTVALNLKKEYHGCSVAPHGGGPAYNHYTFEPTVTMQCKADPQQLQHVAAFNYVTALYRLIAEAIYTSGKLKTFTGDDMAKMDLTWPYEAGFGDNAADEVFNPAGKLGVDVTKAMEKLTPQQRAALRKDMPIRLVLYRKRHEFQEGEAKVPAVWDDLVGVMEDVEKKYCSQSVAPMEIDGPPPMPALSDPPFDITDSPLKDMFWMGIDCAKDKNTGKLYRFEKVEERWKTPTSRWRAMWIPGYYTHNP